ncbi:TPA: chorismate mutase [Streptococcus pyogenes]|nr:chorismate mutase [Streptococcus pyogenes]HES5709771.1 chorismate mutase [Streptococcus pyogenes]HES5933354.1 chorismate mutase [Streptococcus pyogenes]HES5938323.1 chorismate mutase [Streptococcus pyogenes]
MRLEEIRQEINSIDHHLVALLEKRMALVEQVTAYKLANHLPVLDQARENQILDRVSYLVKDQAFESAIHETFKTIMSLSRQYQTQRLTGGDTND